MLLYRANLKKCSMYRQVIFRFFKQVTNNPPPNSTHTEEYKIIKRDLVKLFILNFFYLSFLLALYFINQKSHYLDRWFAHIFHF